MDLIRLLGVSALLCCLAAPAVSQDSDAYDPMQIDLERGKTAYKSRAYCLQCHGWDGNGRGKDARSVGQTPNLREWSSGPEFLREVIACGRPYTAMPYHDRAAYRDDRCYGMTFEDFDKADRPRRGQATMRDEELDALVAYMMVHIVGAGETTLEQCEEFFEPGSSNCRRLRDD